LRAITAVLLLTLLAGCASPTPAAIPLSGRVVAVIAEEHLGQAFAASAPEVDGDAGPTEPIGATLHFRATANHRPWRASITFGTTPHAGLDDCSPPSSRAHGPKCIWQFDTRVAWFTSGGPLYVTSSRGDTSVNIVATNLDWSFDPRNNLGQAHLEQLVALADDARLDGTTDGALQAAGRAYPRWTVDPNCVRSAAAGAPIALDQTTAEATARITPQGIAAVLASHVAATCAGDRPTAGAGSVGAVVHLANSGGWVAAWLTREPADATCPAWSSCVESDRVMTFSTIVRSQAYPARTRLVRETTDGYLIVEVATLRPVTADEDAVVPPAVLREIATDDRLARKVDPALNDAGDRLALCWRLYGPAEG
jgi:hypothetical protein